MRFVSFAFAFGLSLLPTALAQLSTTVGPLTSVSAKIKIKECNVLDYGAKADNKTDIGPPLTAAFNDCKSGGVVVIPSGNYAMATWVTLDDGKAWALQFDGVIYRTGTAGGNMILIENTTDFELFSTTSKGAIQGSGYLFHISGNTSGPRLLRIQDSTSFSVHDIILVDSPVFHLVLDTCHQAEVYNMAIRGGNEGGLDGIDIWGTNIWVHDVEVTNKDECVTTKSPSSNILVEDIYCNWSGGSAIGSLGADTAISDVLYRNVYSWQCNQMMLIKSNGGSGSAKNMVFTNFIGRSNAYSLDIDQYWTGQSTAAGSGVALSNITFSNWHGTEANGAQRGPVKVVCADAVPCTDITIEDFAMWTASGSSQWYSCESAYGSGFCLRSGNAVEYAVSTSTQNTAPAGYATATMPNDLATPSWGTTASIPIPTIPTSFFPGATPIKPLSG